MSDGSPSVRPMPGSTAPPARNATSFQTSFEDLGQPLADVTFVVLDLETTGGPPSGEIGRAHV